MFSVGLESVVLAPSVRAGKATKPERSMPWGARGRLPTFLVRVECWSSMGKNRPTNNIATAEMSPDHLDC